jgi:hypothetical protein
VAPASDPLELQARMNPPEPADELAADAETGWWDQAGTPAPWPDDFPQNWRPETNHVTPEPEQPPF